MGKQQTIRVIPYEAGTNETRTHRRANPPDMKRDQQHHDLRCCQKTTILLAGGFFLLASVIAFYSVYQLATTSNPDTKFFKTINNGLGITNILLFVATAIAYVMQNHYFAPTPGRH
jgi:hypothetical protein